MTGILVLWFLHIYTPLLKSSLNVEDRNFIDIPVGARLPVVIYSLHFDQLWVSVVASICCKKDAYFDDG